MILETSYTIYKFFRWNFTIRATVMTFYIDHCVNISNKDFDLDNADNNYNDQLDMYLPCLTAF